MSLMTSPFIRVSLACVKWICHVHRGKHKEVALVPCPWKKCWSWCPKICPAKIALPRRNYHSTPWACHNTFIDPSLQFSHLNAKCKVNYYQICLCLFIQDQRCFGYFHVKDHRGVFIRSRTIMMCDVQAPLSLFCTYAYRVIVNSSIMVAITSHPHDPNLSYESQTLHSYIHRISTVAHFLVHVVLAYMAAHLHQWTWMLMSKKIKRICHLFMLLAHSS